jgi:hypothetical protein
MFLVDCCFILPPPAHHHCHAPLLPYWWLLPKVVVTVFSPWLTFGCCFDLWTRLMLLPMASSSKAFAFPSLPPLQPKTIASRQTMGSKCCCYPRPPLLPGIRLEGRDMQWKSLDCLHCSDDSWWQQWLVAAVARATMTWWPIVILSAKDNSIEMDMGVELLSLSVPPLLYLLLSCKPLLLSLLPYIHLVDFCFMYLMAVMAVEQPPPTSSFVVRMQRWTLFIAPPLLPL